MEQAIGSGTDVPGSFIRDVENVDALYDEPLLSVQQDLSHWDKVKVLLNRIRWRSPRFPEPPVPPDSSRPG